MKRKAKRGLIITLICFILIVILFCFTFFVSFDVRKLYSEKTHTEKVTKLANERYIKNGNYTGLQVYPLYDENDKLSYFLIDLEPEGYVYVCINENYLPILHLFGTAGKYMGDEWMKEYPWQRYRICIDGKEPEPYNGIQWIKANENEHNSSSPVGYPDNFRLEIDADGEFIFYRNSHFKVANIQDEKRYLLEVAKVGLDLIPAVKRGDKYLNLVSMEEFYYNPDLKENEIPLSNIAFSPKKTFDL